LITRFSRRSSAQSPGGGKGANGCGCGRTPDARYPAGITEKPSRRALTSEQTENNMILPTEERLMNLIVRDSIAAAMLATMVWVVLLGSAVFQ
jgi:hypothetical protein